jgi:hypothetical protein
VAVWNLSAPCWNAVLNWMDLGGFVPGAVYRDLFS